MVQPCQPQQLPAICLLSCCSSGPGAAVMFILLATGYQTRPVLNEMSTGAELGLLS